MASLNVRLFGRIKRAMKTTKINDGYGRLGSRFGYFLIAWIIHCVVFLAFLSSGKFDTFQLWLGGIIGCGRLVVMVFYGVTIFSFCEDLARKTASLEEQNNDLRIGIKSKTTLSKN